MTTTIQAVQAQQKAFKTALTKVDTREQELRLKLTRLRTQTEGIGAGVSGATPTRITVTADHTASDNQRVTCNMTGDITITLPAASIHGITVTRQGTANTLTVDPGSGVTINDSPTITILGDRTSLRLAYDGASNWEIV